MLNFVIARNHWAIHSIMCSITVNLIRLYEMTKEVLLHHKCDKNQVIRGSQDRFLLERVLHPL